MARSLLAVVLLIATAALAHAAGPPSSPASSTSPASSRDASRDASTSQAIAAAAALSASTDVSSKPAVTPLPRGRQRCAAAASIAFSERRRLNKRPNRVCIFDFDDTLKNEGNVVANDAAFVVHAWCAHQPVGSIDRGIYRFAIAIAIRYRYRYRYSLSLSIEVD
jgi:hypothetical protein